MCARKLHESYLILPVQMPNPIWIMVENIVRAGQDWYYLRELDCAFMTLYYFAGHSDPHVRVTAYWQVTTEVEAQRVCKQVSK